MTKEQLIADIQIGISNCPRYEEYEDIFKEYVRIKCGSSYEYLYCSPGYYETSNRRIYYLTLKINNISTIPHSITVHIDDMMEFNLELRRKKIEKILNKIKQNGN
jgi:hypothetical protein